MTIYLTHEIYCDGEYCDDWLACWIEAKANKQRAREIAATNGWIQVRRCGEIIDLCPECAKKFRASKRPKEVK